MTFSFSVLPSVSALTTLQRRDYTNVDSEGSPESVHRNGRTANSYNPCPPNTATAIGQSNRFTEQADVESSNESLHSGGGDQTCPSEQLVVVEEDLPNVDHHHEESIL